MAVSVNVYGAVTAPSGSWDVRIRNGVSSTVNGRVTDLETAGDSPSVTVIVTVVVPATLGAPAILPVAASVNPAGSVAADQV